MKKIAIVTLGCPKNVVATNRIRGMLQMYNHCITENPGEAEAIIVNTCGFIEPAKEESIDCLLEIGRLKAKTGSQLIAVGCLAQRYGEELAKALPEVDVVLNLQTIEKLPQLLEPETDGGKLPGYQYHDGGPVAYLEISHGCSKSCAFCAIPSIQGPYRSRPMTEIMAEARYLVERGAKELVVVGQDTGMYGYDFSGRPQLHELVHQLTQIKRARWIRLLYLQPQHLSPPLVDVLIGSDKVCPYVDIPVQHASKAVLKRMNRWGSGDTYRRLVDKVRARVPDITLRTSVIVGYPGETAADFRELAAFLKDVAFDYVGIFKFSPEEGTAAARLPGRVPNAVVEDRFQQLRALADQVAWERRRRFVGRIEPVLIEATDSTSDSEGRLSSQAPDVDGTVVVAGQRLEVGRLVKVRLVEAEGYDFRGELDA